MRLAASATAATVVLSAADLWPAIPGVPGRTGFHYAAAGAVVTALLAGRGRTAELRQAAVRHAPLLLAALAVVGSKLLSMTTAPDALLAFAHAGRAAACLLFGGTVFALARRDPERVGQALGAAAAGIVLLFALLYPVGLLVPGLSESLFEIRQHQNLGGLPRFQGLAPTPSSAGALMLACVGLLGGLRDPRLRRWMRGVALGIAVAGLAFPTLVVPLLLAWILIPRRRARRAVAALLAVASVFTLWIVVLRVDAGGQEVYTGQPLAAYLEDGRGPRLMPSRRVGSADWGMTYYETRYLRLVRRAGRCWREHPLVGVGGRNFGQACPELLMAPSGYWASDGRAHNEYSGTLAETGLLGALAALALVLALTRGYRFEREGRLATALVLCHLLLGMAGEAWYQFPLAAWLGLLLVERADPSSPLFAPAARPPQPAGDSQRELT